MRALFITLLTQILSIPVECSKSGGILSVPEESETLAIHRNCDRKTTCEYRCPCGRYVYFDVGNYRGFKNYCKKIDPELGN